MNLRVFGKGVSLVALCVLLALVLGACAAGAGAAEGCGDGPARPALTLDYRVEPGSEEVSEKARAQTAEAICSRLEQIGVDGAGIELPGERRIAVALPPMSPAELERAVEVSGAGGRVYFYDWEPNLVGRERTIGGHPGVQPPVAALLAVDREWRAAGRNPTTFVNSQLIYAGALPSRAAAQRVARQAPGETVIVSEFPISEQGRPLRGGTPGWYALRDRPALTGAELVKVEVTEDVVGAPSVSFKFTRRGRLAFQRVTRQIAQRGMDETVGPFSAGQAAARSGHFAVVVDGVVLTRPIINFVENPDGIDGRTGAQISGGLSLGEAEALAAILRSGELPLELTLLSRLP